MTLAPVRESRAAAAAAERARPPSETLAAEVALHALTWLVIGCAVGLLLAVLLLAPRLGELLAPFEYGRWAALHLDLTLYGWLALPLVGALLGAYESHRRPRLARLSLALWSAALIAGAASWLAGRTSGKLFLDWSGVPAWLFAGAQGVLALALAAGLAATWSGRHALATVPARERRRTAVLAALLAALAGVPILLRWSESPALYPPIDPASGGPTGTSLLGSSLGFAAILLLVPRLLRLPRLPGRSGALASLVLAAQGVLFVALGGGDRSNSDPRQVAALASLVVWAFLLPHELGRFEWPAGSRRWLRALFGWGALLLTTGVVQFLPAILSSAKFTNLLVAHAHVAMAGFASALAMLLLQAGLAGGSARGVLIERASYWFWQGGLALHGGALVAIGLLETGDPAAMLRGGPRIEALLALRALAGALQLGAAWRWLDGAAGAAG